MKVEAGGKEIAGSNAAHLNFGLRSVNSPPPSNEDDRCLVANGAFSSPSVGGTPTNVRGLADLPAEACPGAGYSQFLVGDFKQNTWKGGTDASFAE